MEVCNLAYKWVDGPDLLTIEVPGRRPIRVPGCYLNLNAGDFGIEIDRVVHFRVEPGDVMIDAETLETAPLAEAAVVNAPIGLFELQRTHRELSSTSFIPDMFFHDGILYPNGADIEDHIDTVFLPEVSAHLSEAQRREYRDAEFRFDLCPVTRRIIGRYKSDLEMHSRTQDTTPGTRSYDVFVSFAGEDEECAGKLVNALDARGKQVFFSKREITAGWWSEPIDRALESDSCKSMLVIATSRDHVLKPAVTYEYRVFHQMILTGKKPREGLACLIHGFADDALPLPLRSYHIRTFDPSAVDQALHGLPL